MSGSCAHCPERAAAARPSWRGGWPCPLRISRSPTRSSVAARSRAAAPGPATAWWCLVHSTRWGRRWRGFGYNPGGRAASAALGFRGYAPIVDTLVKERLTGALILVGLVVVLVPELLSGPIARTVNTHGPVSAAEEPPLRSYTINLADEPRGGSGSARPQPSAPAAPVTAAPEPAAATTPPPTAAASETEQAPPVTRPPAASAPRTAAASNAPLPAAPQPASTP